MAAKKGKGINIQDALDFIMNGNNSDVDELDSDDDSDGSLLGDGCDIECEEGEDEICDNDSSDDEIDDKYDFQPQSADQSTKPKKHVYRWSFHNSNLCYRKRRYQ